MVFFYISIFMLAAAIGGANNFPMSMISSVFGRYDFANAYRTTWPVVQIIGTFGFAVVGGLASKAGGSFEQSYLIVLVICVIAAVCTFFITKEKVGR